MNMKTVLRLILVGVGAFLSVSAVAQQRKYVNEFLRIGVGGRDQLIPETRLVRWPALLGDPL